LIYLKNPFLDSESQDVKAHLYWFDSYQLRKNIDIHFKYRTVKMYQNAQLNKLEYKNFYKYAVVAVAAHGSSNLDRHGSSSYGSSATGAASAGQHSQEQQPREQCHRSSSRGSSSNGSSNHGRNSH
jgi:hypothetical protein